MIFDSHAHYDDKAFDEDRDELLKYFPENGVCGIINAGTNIETSKKSIELSKNYHYIYAAVGIHPECVSDAYGYALDTIYSLAKDNEDVVAIGEIGLDYHYTSENRISQIEMFQEQIKIAKKLDLPVLVHDRDAHQDTMNLLKKHNPKGVVHCFSGSLEMAKDIIKIGMYLGIGGAVTFKNAKRIIEVVENVPLECIVLETDAPYMAPVPFRGKRCDSTLIEFTAKKIAEIKNVSCEDVLSKTKDNALKLFKRGRL